MPPRGGWGSETYRVDSIADSRESRLKYSVNGTDVLIVDYEDIPMNMDTFENIEKVANSDPRTIKIEVLYISKQPKTSKVVDFPKKNESKEEVNENN